MGVRERPEGQGQGVWLVDRREERMQEWIVCVCWEGRLVRLGDEKLVLQ